MNTADRRAEIISILMVRRRITAKELAEEFNVTIRTIQNDIQALSLGFPIYTRQGGDGGIFVGDNYKPYMNTLTPLELKVLHEMYELADGIHKKVLFQLIRKYGPDKLELYTCHSCKAHNFYNTVHSRRKWLMCFLD